VSDLSDAIIAEHITNPRQSAIATLLGIINVAAKTDLEVAAQLFHTNIGISSLVTLGVQAEELAQALATLILLGQAYEQEGSS
jgi:hypothetical protein